MIVRQRGQRLDRVRTIADVAEIRPLKVVCFSPNDAVWRWTFPQAQFLEALKQRGDVIDYVFCDRAMKPFCISMASSGVRFTDTDEVKSRVCDACLRNSELVRTQFGFSGQTIESFLDADRVAQANDLTASMPVRELYDYKEDDLPIGRLALYETIIQTKAISDALTPEAEAFYRVNARNALISARASRRMLAELKPDIGLSYHTAYAANRAFQLVFENAGVPVWFLNASLNMSEMDTHLVAARSDPIAMYSRLLQDWTRFKDKACDETSIESVTDHLITLMNGGGFAYSVSIKNGDAGALQKLGCPADKKIIGVFLSSYDELLAAELAGFGWTTKNSIFASQLDWVKWLFDFARSRPSIHFIIRVHPREFALDARGTRSEHSYLLEDVFRDNPPNVSINMPSDKISIYDLLMETDVALIAWSSAGMDAGLLGIPVVTYAGETLMFPPQLAFNAKDQDEYARFIDDALAAGRSFERARAFFRYAVLMLGRTRIDLTNGAPTPAAQSPVGRWLRRAGRRIMRFAFRLSREALDIRLRPAHLRDAPRIYALLDERLNAFYDEHSPRNGSVDLESRALKHALQRVSNFAARQRGIPSFKVDAIIPQLDRYQGSALDFSPKGERRGIGP